jgi:hypothetical protein
VTPRATRWPGAAGWINLGNAFEVADTRKAAARWLLHLPTGTFRHENIKAATAKPFEHPAGWIAQPTLIPALGYGLATVVFPFFVLQPALGLGIASSRTPKPAQARLKSLATHTIFGFGMYVSALGIRLIPPV